jgi:O-antigen/teichoic acid export membrane protein
MSRSSRSPVTLAPQPPTAPPTPEIAELGSGRHRTPTQRPGFAIDAMALAASSVITGLLGVVFWAAAARHYSVAEVGRGSAVVSSATMLCTLANLSLGGMYERFLPVAGHRARRLLASGTAIVFLLALLFGAAFVVLAPTDAILTTTSERVAFPFFVAVLSAFALQDNVLTGLRVARWAAVKNIFHSAAKLLLVVLLGVTASGFSIAVASIVPAALAAVVVTVWVFRRGLRDQTYLRDPALPANRELVAFFGSTYGLTVVASLAPLIIPLIVVNQLGTESNAYFTVAWTLVVGIMMLMSVVTGPYIADAAAKVTTDPGLLYTSTRQFIVLISAVAFGGAAFLLFGAPVLLGLFGAGYGEQGSELVRLMAGSIALAVVSTVYGALARIRRRLRLAVVMQVLSALVLVIGTYLLAAPFGLPGIGIAYLLAEALALALVVVPTVRIVREMRAEASPPPAATVTAAAGSVSTGRD